MPRAASDPPESTYPLRVAARLTGLSPELLRAWERRYGAVEPIRTPGGTRRYRPSDLDRLRLLKAAVDAGHRIGQVATLDDEALRRTAKSEEASAPDVDGVAEVLEALERLEDDRCMRLISLRLAALGPARFAREFAVPLVREVGDRWADGRLGIASEHLVSATLRSLLGPALQPTAASRVGPRIVFATPSGERHELGLLMAALTSLGAGANPLYLGVELPVEDLLAAVESTDAAVLALSLVTLDPTRAVRTLRALRGGMPSQVGLWIGGAGAADLDLPQGVEHIENLEALESRVALLEFTRSGR